MNSAAQNLEVGSGTVNTSAARLIRASDIHQFLALYEGALEISDAGMALFSLPGASTFVSRDLDAVTEEAVRRAGRKLEVYVHIHLHQLPAGNGPQRGSLDTVRAAVGLFSDIDARGPGRKKPPATLCPTVQDAISVVQEFASLYSPCRASLIVSSGHGCYPAVLLKEPFVVQSAEDKALLESFGRRYHKALHDIAAKRGWTGAIDYCDPAKVLRLPGCVNYKDPAEPKPVRILAQNDARFTLTDLDEVLPQIQKRTVAPGADLALPETGNTPVALVNDNSLDQLIVGLREAHPLFGPTWDDERPDLADQSCSGLDMALADIGVHCGLTDNQIASLLVAHRQKFRADKEERCGKRLDGYLRRTIGKARAGKTSSAAAEAEQAGFEAKLKAADAAQGQAATAESPVTAPHAEVEVGGAVGDNRGSDEANGDTPAATTEATPEAAANTVHPQVHPPTDFIMGQVRATGDVNIVYANIAVIAGLSDAAIAALYQDLRAVLGTKLNYNHFNRAIKDQRARARQKETVRQQAADPRPIIRTDGRLLDGIAAEAIMALESANNPPVVFRRGGALVMIHPDEDGRPVIMRANEAMMRGRLARVARFQRLTKQGLIWVSPPEDLTRDVLSSNSGNFPPLGVVTQIPILRQDGTYRMEPGYDPVTRAYYVPSPGFRLPVIPAEPTSADVEAGVHLLDEAIGEFPFDTPADKANCIALLLTAFLRIAFRFKVPLAVIDAPKWGTGKTLLAMLVYVITTGSEGTVCTAPTTEEEWRKRLTSLLERGSAVTILDNVDQPLRSPSLSAVLTAPYWEDRVLGRTEDIRLPNVSTWIATGNNLVLGGEMARRAYRIRLDAKVSNPGGRTGFKRTDQQLLDWVAAHRGELVGALLTIIHAWFAAGQPKADVTAFGSFEGWARTTGGILYHAGIDSFLGNLPNLQKEADEESAQWEQFLSALVQSFRGRPFMASEVADKALHEWGMLSLSFPDEIGHPGESSNDGYGSLVRRIGKALAKKCGTRFGDLELRVERGKPDNHTKVQTWVVAGNTGPLLMATVDDSAGFAPRD